MAHAESRMRYTEIRILRLHDPAACICVFLERWSVAQLRVDDARCKRLEMRCETCQHQVVALMVYQDSRSIGAEKIVLKWCKRCTHDGARSVPRPGHRQNLALYHCDQSLSHLGGKGNLYSVYTRSNIRSVQTKALKCQPTQSKPPWFPISIIDECPRTHCNRNETT